MNLSHVFLAVFIFECVVKLVAQGFRPWCYFNEAHDGAWNCFDFMIVVVGIAEVCGSGSGVSFLRLFRLLRLLRLLQFWTELQTIISGLIGGIKASIAIVALIFFVFFLYGTIGTNLFGSNDPVHFGSLFTSMMTLYMISNYEWLDILYVNMVSDSCIRHPRGGMHTYSDRQNRPPVRL